MVTMGIDPSINSTGVCINKDGQCMYFIIASKMTKKMMNHGCSDLTIIDYNKCDVDKSLSYMDRENIKTNNIYTIVKIIKDLVTLYEPEVCRIEGISFGSTGSSALIDLTGLNYMLRYMLIDLKIPFEIISPTSNKQFATGNGQAEKDIIIDAWQRLNPNMKGLNIKVDDIADAYFLSNYKKQ